MYRVRIWEAKDEIAFLAVTVAECPHIFPMSLTRHRRPWRRLLIRVEPGHLNKRYRDASAARGRFAVALTQGARRLQR